MGEKNLKNKNKKSFQGISFNRGAESDTKSDLTRPDRQGRKELHVCFIRCTLIFEDMQHPLESWYTVACPDSFFHFFLISVVSAFV